jgi:hypothetical protein
VKARNEPQMKYVNTSHFVDHLLDLLFYNLNYFIVMNEENENLNETWEAVSPSRDK